MNDGDAPLEHGVREGALAAAGAPSTGSVHSSCCVATSRREARAPRRQQRGGQSALSSVIMGGQVG